MLRYYTCLRYSTHPKSAASIQRLSFKAKLVQSTAASIPLKEIVQSLKECPTIFCNMSDTLSKKYCIHLRTFFRGKTLSMYYYCIYWRILRHRNNTLFYKYCIQWPLRRILPHWPHLFYAMCPVSGTLWITYCIQWRTFFTGKILLMSCSIY